VYQGMMMGWMTLTNGLDGTLTLIKKPVPGSLYPGGFTNEFAPQTSPYTNPATGNRVIELTGGSNGVVVLSGGNLTADITNWVGLSTLNKFKAAVWDTVGRTNKLTLAVAVKTGKLTGSFKPDGVTAQKIAGAVLQDENSGGGHFKAITNTGVFKITPVLTNDVPALTNDMVLIPAGSFTMGDTFGEGWSDELPLHTVYVSAFYMDRYEVTKALWDEVYQWAITNGYSFEYGALGKAANHPVQMVTWYDAVKWCNARSEREGKVAAYYTDAGLTTRYRSGEVEPYVNWSGGYRLPTEAEWEKAARGGASGQRFPWGDTISWGQANYYAYPSGYAYDVNPTEGYHPTFATGGYPYTSPVGYFGANGYGLYDMAGNVWEWCWDWYGGYSSGSQSDPRGPVSGSYRVFRGGGWYRDAPYCRSAYRDIFSPSGMYNGLGFRSVLPPGQ
jgi:sulfatase modifying factor 1